MDLKSFQRGARMTFTLPKFKTIIILDLILIPLTILAGCSIIYLAYVLIILPTLSLLAARPYVNLRRAYGLTPAFLAWGALTSCITGYTPLTLIPPSLLLVIPIRFLKDSVPRSYALTLTALLLLVLDRGTQYLPLALILLIITFGLVEGYTVWLKRKMKSVGGTRILQAYFDYALMHDKTSLEEIFTSTGVKRSVPVYVIDLLVDSRPWSYIIIPHIHPGPYGNLGSSELPYLLSVKIREKDILPVILHGASTHEEDLANSHYVGELAESLLNGEGTLLCEGYLLGIGAAEVEGFRAHALSFDKKVSVVIVERVNTGMEDLPLALTYYLDKIILVDAHNNYSDDAVSPSPLDSLSSSIWEACRIASQIADNNLTDGWRISTMFSHQRYDDEIGRAGISILTLSNEKENFLLIAFDSNNMRREFRDILYHYFADKWRYIITVTTDTHELTGIRAGFTYKPLGTTTYPLTLISDIEEKLAAHASISRPLKYRVRKLLFESVFLNRDLLVQLSIIMKDGIKYALLLLLYNFILFMTLPLIQIFL
ncbi:MAG: DUF2070 family protein [Thermofilaceae archaeon]